MKLFITHYTPLVERKQKMIQQFEEAGFDPSEYEFIEEYDREVLTQSDLEKFREIRLAEISLFLKHIEIFKMDIEDIVVVLEDDSIFTDNFKSKLEQYLTELGSMEWDVVFTGECCGIHSQVEPNKTFYDSNGSRGTCMYILNRGVCKKLNDIVNAESTITLPVDHWFNYINSKYNLKYYHSEPTLVSQGSEIGIFPSAIR